jgi:hypothetical protein
MKTNGIMNPTEHDDGPGDLAKAMLEGFGEYNVLARIVCLVPFIIVFILVFIASAFAHLYALCTRRKPNEDSHA